VASNLIEPAYEKLTVYICGYIFEAKKAITFNMVNPLIKKEIEQQLNRLPEQLQRRVLEYALTLSPEHRKGVKGQSLLHFAGTIAIDDLDAMKRAIERDCEHVDQHEW